MARHAKVIKAVVDLRGNNLEIEYALAMINGRTISR